MPRNWGFALVGVVTAVVATAGIQPGAAGATCDASAFHLTVTDLEGNTPTEPDGSAVPAHRLPDSLINKSYFVNITITGGQPPYQTGYGGYSLPPGINKSISSSPGTDNNDIVTIEGKASESYAASLILTVLDHNGCGPTPADSRFDWLYGQAPSNTGSRPTIPIPITVGDTPSCDAGGWTGDANYPAITFTYQWQRINASGPPTNVGTAQTYPTTPADGGSRLVCVVTATNKFGSAKATSNSVRVRYPPENIRSPTIPHSGPVQPGKQLRCDKGSWVGADPITYSYRWVSHRSTGSPVVSTTDTYTPTAEDAGWRIDCTVTATNQDGTASLTTDQVPVYKPGLVITRVVVLGWGHTGNLDWIRNGGPPTSAEPQNQFSPGESALVLVRVENQGQAPSNPDEVSVVAIVPSARHPEVLSSGLPQPIGAIQPGESVSTSVVLKLHQPRFIRGDANFTAIVKGTHNQPSLPVSVPGFVYDPPAFIKSEKVSNPNTGFKVNIDVAPPDLPPKEVLPQPAQRKSLEVALLQLGNGATAARAGPATCKWIADASGKLASRKGTGRECATPIWLKAKLRGHRGSFSLHRRLGPGRYVLYTRILDRAGLYNPIFSAKNHNRLVFTVH